MSSYAKTPERYQKISKFNSENYDEIKMRVYKGMREPIKKYFINNTSVSNYLWELIVNDISQHLSGYAEEDLKSFLKECPHQENELYQTISDYLSKK